MAGKRFEVSTIFRAVDKVTRPMRRMTRTVVKGAKVMGRALVKLTKLVGKLGRGLLNAAGQAVKMGGAGVVGLTAAVTVLNKGTVEAERLSQAVGMSTDTMEALAAAIKPAGFELDHVVDLVEEMNNKFGESAGLQQTLPVQESLSILGLKFEELKKLKPEEQFRTVSNAILNLKDSAKAVSAADILFGGEANKVFGVLRQTGKDFDGLVGRYKELNFQTDESRAGAGNFVRSLGRVTTLIATMARFISGLVGDALAPMIDKWADWVVQNKDLIKTKIVEFVAKLPGILQRISEGASEAFDTMSKWSGFFENLGAVAGPVLRMIKDGFVAVGTFIGETIAKIVIAVDSLLEKLNRAVAWVKEVANTVGSALDSINPFSDDEQTVTRSGGVSGSMSSPVQRTANILEDRRTTNTTEVILRDSTGKAQVVGGGNSPGFNLISTGGF